MVINNWFVVIDMCSTITGRSWYVKIFFFSFYTIVVLILVNIVIAIVLEIHDSLKEEIDT